MSLKKSEISLIRLKGKSRIDPLFESGTVYRTSSLMLRLLKDEKSNLLAASVSVAKRNFGKAVHRNRIKRQLRIAIKSLETSLSFSGICMLVYTGKQMPQYSFLIEETKRIFQKASN